MTRFESVVARLRVIRGAFGLLPGAALLMVFLTVSSNSAQAQFVGPTPLTLINGWTNAPFGTSRATVEEVAGIVQFRGSIATTGTNLMPFTLSPALRPLTTVYVPIDLCNATKGRLIIQPSGTVSVQAETAFSNAQCFTSLDGASFARNATGFAALALLNGWTNAPYNTSNAAVRLVNGIVHFKGAIAGGTTIQPFNLPVGLRPATNVYIPVDLCNATNGWLFIQHTGVVTIQAEGGTFTNAQCFTSLDGAWFAPGTTGFTPLTPINGWTNAPSATSIAEARNVYGLVYFKGAIATSGINVQPFALPLEFRPVTNVYVPIDLCNATKGRLVVQPSGAVSVQAETVFSNAQCFTSLDGASFVQ